MFPIIGPIIAALGGALGLGAAGGAATGIGALFSNAWLPALGTGIGTLLTGGSGKDALRNAAMAGGGSMLFPGIGKGVSGGIAQLMGIGGHQISGPTNMGMAARYPPPARPAGLAENLAATQAVQAPAAPIKPIGGEDPRLSIPPSGLPAMSRIGQDPRVDLGNSFVSKIPLDPRLESLPEIPQMESSSYQSPYVAMMRDEQDRQKTAGEDLLRYSPDVTQTPSEKKFDLGNRSLDLMYQGYNERPDIMSGDVDPSIAKHLPYIDPYTMKRFATKEERDAAMEQSAAYRASDAPLRTYIARKYATGGEIQGPGNGTSDSVPATIYQGGKAVKDAALSDGEFVMTAKAVRGMGNGSRERGVTRMYELMRRFENGEMA
jgi:hypothetical protein